jgi:hypothetical protein
MTNKAEAQAQRIWVELGGIGPVPRQMVNAVHSGGVSVNDPSADYWRCKATKLRHRTRLRLVASALAGTCGDGRSAAGVATLAFDVADAVLARLDAEAKGNE